MELTKEEEAYIKERRKAEKKALIYAVKEQRERFSEFMSRLEKTECLISGEGVTTLGWAVAETASSISKIEKELGTINDIRS
jgi:hypothetical protein